MRKLSVLVMVALVGCGSVEGNWNGTCENPENGDAHTFNLDIDTDNRDGITGSAFLTISESSGDTSIVECTVSGEDSGGEVSLEFVCTGEEPFWVDLTKEGGNLVGYCDPAREIGPLTLVQD